MDAGRKREAHGFVQEIRPYQAGQVAKNCAVYGQIYQISARAVEKKQNEQNNVDGREENIFMRAVMRQKNM